MQSGTSEIGTDLRPSSNEQQRRLAAFSVGDYAHGRNLPWRVAWFVAQNLLFDRWWFPARWRPSLLRMFGAKVGSGCLIRHGVRVHWPWNLTLGDDVWVGEGAWIHSLVEITIESDVCVSQRASLVTGSHDHRDPAFSYDNAPIVLRRGCWVGTGATVLRGVTVGRNAVIGAGAVAYCDVPDASRITIALEPTRPSGP